MHILIIDNDHLPNLVGDSIHKITLKKPDDNRDSFDNWVSDELGRIFSSESFDMIVLPYSLSSHNYMDYSGLNVAAHIRLTPEWEHTHKPILFIGFETPSFVAKFSPLGDILFTPYVFTTQTGIQSLDKWEMYITNSFTSDMSESQYLDFIDKMHIHTPEKYDSHHSITNEWCVERWSDMLRFDIKDIKMDYKNLLFYKFLRAKLGEPQKFNNKWWKDNPSLLKIGFEPDENYKIAYIDDEYYKGWKLLLTHLFESQSHSITFTAFTDFKNGEGRDVLINKINAFVDECDADCYILDLRLHESDFNKDIKIENLTGHKIAQHIKNNNKANQIVIFTASNKVWNLKKELHEIGASGYVIKESPELLYNRNQTYRNFEDFKTEILHACHQSYIKQYVNATKEFNENTLDSFVDLLLIDKTKDKKDVLFALILQLMVFIEDYVLRHFEIRDGDNLYLKGSSERIANIGKKIRFHQVGDDDDKYFEKVSCKDNVEMTDDYFNVHAKSKDKDGNTYTLTMTIAALYFFYKFPGDLINLFLDARNQRNRNIAHHGNEVNMPIDDVKRIFEDIIVPILKDNRISE